MAKLFSVSMWHEKLDELEEKLQINVRPMTWPIGIGATFKGVYNLIDHNVNPDPQWSDEFAKWVTKQSADSERTFMDWWKVFTKAIAWNDKGDAHTKLERRCHKIRKTMLTRQSNEKINVEARSDNVVMLSDVINNSMLHEEARGHLSIFLAMPRDRNPKEA